MIWNCQNLNAKSWFWDKFYQLSRILKAYSTLQNEIHEVHIREEKSLSLGTSVTAWRGTKGSYSLGEKGKRAETVAQECLDNLKKETKDVDIHLADQLLLYAALAEGKTEYTTSEISNHLKTNAYVISKFLDRKIETNEKISVE